MKCFMFPGQPLERNAAIPTDRDFTEISGMVRDTTGLDLDSFQWLAGEGSENVRLQIFGVAHSLYRLRALRREGVLPHYVAQHSMGIYPALVACGSIREQDALEITWRVGVAISQMAEREEYALGCVIGLTLERVLDLARNNNVYLANHNTSRHFLLAGRKGDIAIAIEEAVKAGAFSTRTFCCDAPLHTPLMAPLEGDFWEIFSDYRYAEPECPLLNHLDQQPLEASSIGSFMLRELSLPVYWDATYRALRNAGCHQFHELGAGESLKKYCRWIEGEL
jgi:[acyl-carrier-protein] S-malonyltransferase